MSLASRFEAYRGQYVVFGMLYVCVAVIYNQKALKPSIHAGPKAMVEITALNPNTFIS